MKKRLSGKVIIITGAESGIGKSIALRCVEDGASVVAAGLDESGLEITSRECIALSGEEHVTFRLTDVRDPDAIEELVNHTTSKFGHIDAAVANAGVVLGQQPLTEITLEDWNTIISTKLTGVFLTLQAVARVLIKLGKGGSLLATGSSTAIKVAPNFTSYIAAKGGVHAMLQALALELADKNIRVNTIVPGTTKTPITENIPGYLEKVGPTLPMKEVVEPYELANFVAFALSDDAPHMTGTLLKIDAGRVLA